MADSETMKIIIQARDEATATLKRIASGLRDLEAPAKRADRAIDIFRQGMQRAREAITNFRQQVFTLKNAIIGAVAAFGAFKIYSFVKDATLLAARYRTLGITLVTLGEQAGYNAAQMDQFEEGLKKTGIAALNARSILAKMIQSQLDLTKATKLARVAQDAAVIAGLNSSETFQRMIHAIQANSVEILRTIGMNVSFEKSYKVLAKQLDISVDQMTEAQKVQARFNAVLRGGTQIAGAYTAAMATAGKQMLSFSRYVSDFNLAIGEAFEPALAIIVSQATLAIKAFTASVKDPQFLKTLEDFAKIVGQQLQKAFMWLIDNKDAILNVIVEITRSLGDSIVSLNRVIELLFGSQKRLAEANKESFNLAAQTLAKYVQEREQLQAKLAYWDANAKSANANLKDLLAAELDFGKTERKIKELDALIVKFRKLAGDAKEVLDESTKPPEGKNELVAYWDDVLLSVTDIKISGKDPLGSNLMASAFKRAALDIKRELDILSSEYNNNIIKLGLYYDERERLAKENFENELKYLEAQASKQQDPDKRLKIEDKIYALKLKYASDETKLTDERRKAVKKFADDRLAIEKTLQNAKLDVLRKATSTSPDSVYKLELEQLKTNQDERRKRLVEDNATITQLKELEVTEELERQNLKVEQERRTAERVLEIRRTLEDAKLDILSQSGSVGASNKIELVQLKRSQEDRLKALKDGKATRDQLKENEIISNQERHFLEAEQEKRAAQRVLAIRRTLEDAKLALIDPNNLQAVFDSELTQLERFQSDRLQSIKDAKLTEQQEIEAIEDANRLSQLEKDKLHVEQRLRLQKIFVDGVSEVLTNLNTLFGDIYTVGGSKQKEFFHLQKAVAVVQATIATYESAVQAYKWGMSFGGPAAPALAAGAAAIAVASGLAKVAVIKSQSLAEGGVVKGHSPSPKADNIQTNLTAGEFVHPVDVVKYYGMKGMELIRQKLIPPELLYQLYAVKEKKESVKESFTKNLENTSNYIKDYSQKLLSLYKSKKSSDSLKSSSSAISRSKDRIASFDKTISATVIDQSTRDNNTNDVIITKLFEKIASDKSKVVKSKVKLKSTKELIDVRRDKERIASDRVITDRSHTIRSDSDRFVSEKDRESTRYISTSNQSDRTRERDRSRQYDKDSSHSDRSRIFVSKTVRQSGTFLNNLLSETFEKQKTDSAIKEVLRSTSADKLSERLLTADKTNIKIKKVKIKTKKDRSIIDRVIDRAISDKLINNNLVDRSSVTKSIIDKVIQRMATDKLNISQIVSVSKFNEVIDRSITDKVFNSINVDRAIESAVKDRIFERSQVIINRDQIVKDKLADSIYKLSSDIQTSFTTDKITNDAVSSIKEIKNSEKIIEDIIHGDKSLQPISQQKTLLQNTTRDSVSSLVDRKVITDGLLESYLKVTDISKSLEAIASIRENRFREVNNISDKSNEKVEKLTTFAEQIVLPIRDAMTAIVQRPLVIAPVIIRDTSKNKETLINSYKELRIGSNLVKSIHLRTSESIQKLASGGSILGSSPNSRADNITIKATAGEFMQPVDVVKFYTAKGMEAIRQKIIPREVIAHYANNIQLPKPNYSHAFALGGEIPKTRETSGSAQDAAEKRQISITNLVDPAVFEQFLASSTGEQQLVNVISANKFQIKGILDS